MVEHPNARLGDLRHRVATAYGALTVTVDLLDDEVDHDTAVEAYRLAELAALELSDLSAQIAVTLAELAFESENAAGSQPPAGGGTATGGS